MKTGRHFRHNGVSVNKDFKGRKGSQVVRRQANKEVGETIDRKKAGNEDGVWGGSWGVVCNF